MFPIACVQCVLNVRKRVSNMGLQVQVQVQYVEVPGPVQYVEGPVQYIEREGPVQYVEKEVRGKTKTVTKEVPECSSCGWVGVISQPCSITFYAFSCPGVCSNPVIF